MKKKSGTIILSLLTILSVGVAILQLLAAKDVNAGFSATEKEYNTVYTNVSALEEQVAAKEAAVAEAKAAAARAENYIKIVESDNEKLAAKVEELKALNEALRDAKWEIELGNIESISLEEWAKALVAEAEAELGLPPTHIDVDVPGAVASPNQGSDLTLADLPKNLEGNVGVLPSPVAGATLVSTSDRMWSTSCYYVVDTYSNGMKVVRTVSGSTIADPQFWLLRTDYSDGLQDADGNGLDDRDPLNNCGYSDLNFNCIIDGAPTYANCAFEWELTPFRMCEHNVMEGVWNVCSHPDCVALYEMFKNVKIN